MATKRSLKQLLQSVGQRVLTLWSKRGLYSVLLALVLTILNYYAIYFPWIVDDHDILVNAMGLKKITTDEHGSYGLSRQEVARDFLLIDVSNDMTIHCDTGANSRLKLASDSGYSSGPCVAALDLPKLTQLFKWLSENTDQYKIVVCDLAFEDLPDNAESRKLLSYALNLLQRDSGTKIIFGWTLDTDKELFSKTGFATDIPDDYKGVVNEDLTSNMVFKYRLSYQDCNIKTLPLLMLEHINGYTIRSGPGDLVTFTMRDSSWVGRNTFIPEILLDNEQLDSLQHLCTQEGVFADTLTAHMDLWQTRPALGGTKNFYLQEVLATKSTPKKSIFIGSFNHQHRDMHKTLYGDIDGASILLNTYYSILRGSNALTVSYYLFMLFIFWIVSLFLLFPVQNSYKGKKVWLRVLLDFGIELIQYALFFILIYISTSLFHQTSNAIILLAAIAVLERLIRAARENKNRVASKEDTPQVVVPQSPAPGGTSAQATLQ